MYRVQVVAGSSSVSMGVVKTPFNSPRYSRTSNTHTVKSTTILLTLINKITGTARTIEQARLQVNSVRQILAPPSQLDTRWIIDPNGSPNVSITIT